MGENMKKFLLSVFTLTFLSVPTLQSELYATKTKEQRLERKKIKKKSSRKQRDEDHTKKIKKKKVAIDIDALRAKGNEILTKVEAIIAKAIEIKTSVETGEATALEKELASSLEKNALKSKEIVIKAKEIVESAAHNDDEDEDELAAMAIELAEEIIDASKSARRATKDAIESHNAENQQTSKAALFALKMAIQSLLHTITTNPTFDNEKVARAAIDTADAAILSAAQENEDDSLDSEESDA